VECVAGYKDTYIRLRVALAGITVVLPARPRESKVARASIFEALFEAGEVYLVKGDWNQDWIDEFNQFPKGEKDDQVDSLGLASADDVDAGGRMSLS
jgi:predicted phage terminase large subunit-like protein